MIRYASLFGVTCVVALAVSPCVAQGGPMPPSEVPTSTSVNSSAAIDQVEKFGNYVSMRKIRQKMSNGSGKSLEELLAEDKAEAEAVIAGIKLPCGVSDVLLRGEGEETAKGGTIKTRIFEVACDSGVGYVLVKRDPPGMSSAFSCFAAEATREADVKAGRQPGLVCGLAANADLKAMAAAVIVKAGNACSVRDSRWIGQSDANKTDYFELACAGGKGFVLASPLAGSHGRVTVSNCRDSAKVGASCKLTDSGVVVSAQTVKRALADQHVACDAAEMRLVGKESIKKRRVVELSCPQQHPGGLIALIPFDDDATAPFEVIDCAEAAKRGIACKYLPPRP